MIGRILRFALEQRFITIVLAVALIGLGLYSFRQLKVEAYPDISDTQVIVITTMPGQAAEEMEQQVTIPIERALNSVPNVIARRSRTIYGLSVVEITFTYDTNDYFARQVVLEKLRDLGKFVRIEMRAGRNIKGAFGADRGRSRQQQHAAGQRAQYLT